MLWEPSSRHQPQHWIKYLDPWVRDSYQVLAWGLAPLVGRVQVLSVPALDKSLFPSVRSIKRKRLSHAHTQTPFWRLLWILPRIRESETTIKIKFAFFGGGAGGAERKIAQNSIFHGKRHDNNFLKVNFYCREILLSWRRLLQKHLFDTAFGAPPH